MCLGGAKGGCWWGICVAAIVQTWIASEGVMPGQASSATLPWSTQVATDLLTSQGNLVHVAAVTYGAVCSPTNCGLPD